MQVGLGKALPNAAETKLDRGAAKIANVDPTILGRFKTWFSMQKENTKQVKKKVAWFETMEKMAIAR